MVIDLLKELIAIPSVSGAEGTIAQFVFDRLASFGLSPKRKGDNVWCVVGSGKGPKILLNSHLDTVPAGSEWKREPYEPTEEGGKIFGLGSNDAKSSVAALITTVSNLKNEISKHNGTIVLAITCNEEMGRMGLETVIEELKPLDAGIVGEPNGMKICVAQKGVLILDFSWTGIGAHAAHGTTDHALKKCMQDLIALSELRFGKSDPFLGETRLEVTQLHAGERKNVIPDSATATVDIRYTPVYDSEEILGKIRAAVRGEVRVYSDRRRAIRTDPASQIVKAAQAAQPGIPLVGSGTSSDWVFLSGIPSIKMGPGDTRRSHTADEFVEVSQVTKAVEIYSETVRRFLRDS
ncbi:MAG: M20/M25/M40 family metallo-hydrolase [Pseudomonadota bacterium]